MVQAISKLFFSSACAAKGERAAKITAPAQSARLNVLACMVNLLFIESEEFQIALDFPVGNMGVVGIPFVALVVDEGLVHGVAEDLARQRVGLEGVDGFGQRARQGFDAHVRDILFAVVVHVFAMRLARFELVADAFKAGGEDHRGRSEEHTSELQSLMRNSYAVFCLKKKKQTYSNRLTIGQNKEPKTDNQQHAQPSSPPDTLILQDTKDKNRANLITNVTHAHYCDNINIANSTRHT